MTEVFLQEFASFLWAFVYFVWTLYLQQSC